MMVEGLAASYCRRSHSGCNPSVTSVCAVHYDDELNIFYILNLSSSPLLLHPFLVAG